MAKLSTKATHGGRRRGAGRPKGQGPYGEATKPIRIPLSLLGDVARYVKGKGYRLPLYGARVPAGAPSVLEDHLEGSIDLNELIVKNPESTYLVRVQGDSMINAGIREGDVLVVDRAREPKHNDVVIVAIDNELTVKRLFHRNGRVQIMPDNPDYEPIILKKGERLEAHGVVVFTIHQVKS